ncbi:putative transcriptional regulator [Bacillus sp. TS-2]|nr:putative transcriptional regulator [Bacillus sp. TS-2]
MRPIKYTDEQIFLGLYKALTLHGFSKLSLEKIAKEANVSAAILSKRYGSKKGLILNYFNYALKQTQLVIHENQLKEANIETLENFLIHWSIKKGDAAAIMSMIEIYSEGVKDDELRKISQERSVLIDLEVQRLLKESIDKGEIEDMDVKETSFLLQSTALGVAMVWLNKQDQPLDGLVKSSIYRIVGLVKRRGE